LVVAGRLLVVDGPTPPNAPGREVTAVLVAPAPTVGTDDEVVGAPMTIAVVAGTAGRNGLVDEICPMRESPLLITARFTTMANEPASTMAATRAAARV
jgi:hypothetical protein